MNLLGNNRYLELIAGVGGLLLGWYFYINFRGFDPVTGVEGFEILKNTLGRPFHNSFPSFIHSFSMLSLSLFFFGGRRRNYIWSLFWVMAGFVFEGLSSTFIKIKAPLLYMNGVFDRSDLLAVVVGVLAANLVNAFLKNNSGVFSKSHFKSMGKLLLIAFGFISTAATSKHSGEAKRPVYLAYEAFRSSVSFEETRPLKKSGKILKLENYIFVSEPFAGVHVFDNSLPENPVAIGFINLPGNTDIAIRGTTLYGNSYFDLVVIDFSDFPSIEVTKRFDNIIKYDPNKSAPNCFFRNSTEFDPEKGVVTDCL